MLKDKIEYSISLLKKAEKLALTMSDKGFYLAFSGGKDSQCLYHIAKMAGVKFEAHFSLTTFDPPELVHFIKDNYPDVIIERPPLYFLQLCIKKKMLPTMRVRFCCAVLKEQGGAGTVTLIGIRNQESARRSGRKEVETKGGKFVGTLDQFNRYKETEINCVKGKDKILISPIISWTNNDVWTFIRSNKIPYCKLYDEGYTRIGCLFCPMSSLKSIRRDEIRFPKYKIALIKTIDKMLKNGCYSDLSDQFENLTANDLYEAWISKEKLVGFLTKKRDQFNIF